jgi:hypothetical protein
VVDRHPEAELTVSGTRSESYLATRRADGLAQALSEGVEGSAGGEALHSALDHRWRLSVPGGERVELHVTGYRQPSLDGDDFAFELSSDGGRTWTPVSLPSLPLAPESAPRVAPLPSTLAGEILLRVVDTRREPGLLVYDTVYVDEIFVRSIS